MPSPGEGIINSEGKQITKVLFQTECNAGDNLLELTRRANVAIDAPCSVNGTCGKCRVKLLEGEVESIPLQKGESNETIVSSHV